MIYRHAKRQLYEGCTMYSVQCTVYNVQCTMYSVQCTVFTLGCFVHLYNIQFTHYTMFV